MSSLQLRPTTPITTPRRLAIRGVKSLPVAGYTHRWNPSALSLLDGAGVYQLPDLIGTTHMTVANTAPTLGTETDGRRYLVNAAADRLTTATDVMDLAVCTIAVVAKVDTVPTGVGLFVGSVAPNVTVGVNAGKFYGGAGTSIPTLATNTTPHVFIFTANGASSAMSVDGTEWTGNAGTNHLTEVLLFGGDNTNVIRGRIYDVIVYPTALTAAQRALLAAHLRSENGI
jgi:hypothetical protein